MNHEAANHEPINPETSDPNDPETNTWWIWIPLLFAFFVIFMWLVFGRDLMYESRSAAYFFPQA